MSHKKTANVNQETKLPQVFVNLKKILGRNISGPISQREREFHASTKTQYMQQIAKFLSLRGVKRLAGIHAWKSEDTIKIAYHFIGKIGQDFFDSSLTVLVVLDNKKEVPSIVEWYPNARVFEEDICSQLALSLRKE
jgi:NADH:ubiquinone oxidoreductase subunit C